MSIEAADLRIGNRFIRELRVAEKYGTTPDSLCESISKKTGEKKSVIDIVIWRACNLKLL